MHTEDLPTDNKEVSTSFDLVEAKRSNVPVTTSSTSESPDRPWVQGGYGGNDQLRMYI